MILSPLRSAWAAFKASFASVSACVAAPSANANLDCNQASCLSKGHSILLDTSLEIAARREQHSERLVRGNQLLAQDNVRCVTARQLFEERYLPLAKRNGFVGATLGPARIRQPCQDIADFLLILGIPGVDRSKGIHGAECASELAGRFTESALRH